MAEVWASALMPAPVKLVALSLAQMANDEGVSWPSVATIARNTSLKPRTVQRQLRDLEACGALAYEERPGQSRRYTLTPSLYTPANSVTPAVIVTPVADVTGGCCNCHPRGVVDVTPGGVVDVTQNLELESSVNRHVPALPVEKAEVPSESTGRGQDRAPGTPSATPLLPGVDPPAEPTGRRRAGKAPPSAGESALARDVLEYLNRIAGSRFQPTATNLGFIVDRLAEGYTAHVLKLLAFHRLTRWRNDPKMIEYLRPATLYNGEKCNQYAGQVPALYFKTCATCAAEVMPDAGGCPNGCDARAAAAADAAGKKPMPEHIRRREGEPIRAWMDRLKAEGATT